MPKKLIIEVPISFLEGWVRELRVLVKYHVGYETTILSGYIKTLEELLEKERK